MQTAQTKADLADTGNTEGRKSFMFLVFSFQKILKTNNLQLKTEFHP